MDRGQRHKDGAEGGTGMGGEPEGVVRGKGERLRGDRCRWRWGHGERQGTEMAGGWGQVSNRVGEQPG